MLYPSFLFIIDNLFETQISNGILVLSDLIFVFKIEKSVLGHNNITVDIEAIIYVLIFFKVVLKAQMLTSMLVKPSVVIVILLLHEAFFNNDCENVNDDAHRNKDETVKIQLCSQVVNLNHIIIGVKDHITMHQSK
jgi:hypothetical protein